MEMTPSEKIKSDFMDDANLEIWVQIINLITRELRGFKNPKWRLAVGRMAGIFKEFGLDGAGVYDCLAEFSNKKYE